MEYYYTPKSKVNTASKELVIDGFEYKHLAKVLRKKVGDEVEITDGELNIYKCRITGIDKEKIKCSIEHTDFDLYEPKIRLSLYIAPLKNSSRFEFAIEKAVELGVHSIHPVITENTVNKSGFNETKLRRLHRIIISAMGQSQRCYLPGLSNAVSFDEMLDNTVNLPNKVVMYEFSESGNKYKLDNDSNDLALLVGPEGGFSTNEIEKLTETGWQASSLGERKLRAETAVIVSIYEMLNHNY